MPDPDPLYSQEAEEALLGAVILDPALIIELPVDVDHFYIHRHRMIWEALKSLLARQIVPDYVTLSEELNKQGKLGEIGGPAYLTQLLNSTPTSLHAEAYAQEVIDLAKRREWMVIANSIVKSAHDRRTDLNAQAGAYIDRLSRAAQSEHGAVAWNHYLDDVWEYVTDRIDNPQDAWGIRTGYKDFDKITGGLQPGELMILSGKPGVGKSLWAMEMAHNLAYRAPGAIYSIEMTGRQVAMRILSAVSGVATRRMKTGQIEGGDFPLIMDAINTLKEQPVYMSDAAGHTTASIRADLARLRALYGIQWFVIDYLLLLGDMPELKEYERAAVISRNVKLICRSLNLAGVLIHSMLKDGMDDKEPSQSKLRGSAQVSYDADLIIFLTEFTPLLESDKLLQKKDKDNMRTVIFGKGRELEDPRKGFHLVKLLGQPTFRDYETAVR